MLFHSGSSSVNGYGEEREIITDEPRTANDMFPGVDESKVVRKIDTRVVPVLCLLYLLAFLDR